LNGLSRAELLALPPATCLPVLGAAFGLSEPVARERHRRGEWAAMGIRVVRLGHQYRVVTADIWRVLGVSPDADSHGIAPPGAAAHNGAQQNGYGKDMA